MNYKVILIDPPWPYDFQRIQKNGGMTYPTMKMKDIIDLPIGKLADKDSVLLLWITHPKLPQAHEIINSWGFEWKTTGFDWIKTNQDGSIRMGLGHHTRSASELCLLATKGKGLKRIDNTVMQVQTDVIRGHSAKPPKIRDEIVRLYGPQKSLEIFARDRHPNFDAIGNEISGLDIRDEIDQMLKGTWVQR